MDFDTVTLSKSPDAIAPDGSGIRSLPQLAGGSMAHCTLPEGACSLAVTHRTVEEIWYCIAGVGEVWRRQGDHESVEAFRPGVAMTIPLGTYFQFRAGLGADLQFVIVTMPPWPADDEAYRVSDHWSCKEAT